MKKICCSNCKFFRKVIAYNFMNDGANGVEHINLPGYLCLGFTRDNPVVLMLGLNPDNEDICELFDIKEDENEN